MNFDKISDWTKDWASTKFLNAHYFSEVESTNSFAKDNPPEDEFELILTDHQTKGRGRGSNEWIDVEPGTTLLSSWVFQMVRAPQPISTPLIGLVLYHSALKVWPSLRFSLKAPNDLYCLDKKVAGLLIETVTEGVSHYLIIGLGFNAKSHPKVDRSGSIEEFLNPHKITRDQWFRFLDFFKAGLDGVMFEVANSVINDRKRLLILEALNNYPLLDRPYLEVLPDGGLRSASGVLNWHTL